MATLSTCSAAPEKIPQALSQYTYANKGLNSADVRDEIFLPKTMHHFRLLLLFALRCAALAEDQTDAKPASGREEIWYQATASAKQPAIHPEAGLPFLHNFHPGEYAAVSPFLDNWCILQDRKGVMVIGNTAGVLLYNGRNWQLVETPAKSTVRTLAMDEKGQVFVGASDDLGYLAVGKNGKTTFVSLLSRLPARYRKFGDIRHTLAAKEGIYFITNQYVLCWNGKTFRQWKAQTTFSFASLVNGKLYVQQPQKGLYTLENDQLRLFSDHPVFTESFLSVLLPFDEKRLLAGTRGEGLFIFTGTTCLPFSAETNGTFGSHNLNFGMRLPDGTFALATLRRGVVIVDSRGKIQRWLNRGSGLRSDGTYTLALDRQGSLWITTDRGLSRVEISSPFSAFTESNGLVGNIQQVQRYQGKLYVATSAGLFVLHPQQTPDRLARFQLVSGIDDAIWRLFPFEDQLLLAGTKHLYQLRGDKISIIKQHFITDALHRWKQDPSIVLVSADPLYTKNGVHILRWTGSSWQDEGEVPGLYENIHTILETESGELLLATNWQGIVRVTLPPAKGASPVERLKKPVITHLREAQGIPKGANVLYQLGNQVLLRAGTNPIELHRYDSATHRFARDFGVGDSLGNRFGSVYPAFHSVQPLWLWTKNPHDKTFGLSKAVKQLNGSYVSTHFNLNRIKEYLGKLIYSEGDTVIWFRGSEGIVRYNAKQAVPLPPAFPTLLDRLVINRDSAFYASTAFPAQLPHDRNTLRFEFAAPTYDLPGENEFQYQLEGYDQGWSGWTKESYTEYTRIPSGHYQFIVRARNLYGQVGKVASYSFRVLPPWYQTWPLYGVYALFSGCLVYGLVRWRSARLQARNEFLEKTVTERTQEVTANNHQLEQQAQQLARQTEQLRELNEGKSNFFANLSHEFRTPLTLILGTLNDKLSPSGKPPATGNVTMPESEAKVMQRNARRLLHLITQLLDLSKVESGKLTLELQNGDLTQLIQGIAASFSTLAEYRHIHFSVHLHTESVYCRFDADKVEKILYNLLSNAFKFTADGGRIGLEVRVLVHAVKEQPERIVQIAVQDSGVGIPADQLDKVFDRFFQGAASYQTDQQGTGIGLALTRELVQLHAGTIRAESQPGQGTLFVVELPLADPAPEEVPSPETANAEPLSAGGSPTHSIEALELSPQPRKSGISKRASAGNGLRPTVLVVEDNQDLRQYLKGHLQAHYTVLESVDGEEGWQAALNAMPDLIISDWMMPGMNGLELCQRIKTDERTGHISFILLTALATSEAKLAGLETGADEYIAKPFDAHELRVRVHNLFATRQKLRERFAKDIRLQPKDIAVSSAEEKFLHKVLSIVEAHLSDPDFSAEQFSQQVGLSRMQLHRKLLVLTGKSTTDFVRTVRLKRAAQLLEAQSATVSEIAFGLGFSSLSYFSRSFREHFGVNPTEYSARKAPTQID